MARRLPGRLVRLSRSALSPLDGGDEATRGQEDQLVEFGIVRAKPPVKRKKVG